MDSTDPTLASTVTSAITFSSEMPCSDCGRWKSLLAEQTHELEQTRLEFQEFQTSSKELEHEMDEELARCQKELEAVRRSPSPVCLVQPE